MRVTSSRTTTHAIHLPSAVIWEDSLSIYPVFDFALRNEGGQPSRAIAIAYAVEWSAYLFRPLYCIRSLNMLTAEMLHISWASYQFLIKYNMSADTFRIISG